MKRLRGDDAMTGLRDALIGFSDWLGYGHGERAEAWVQRLEVNRPELEAFRRAGDCFHPPYAARATTLEPAQGIRSSAPALHADAAAALERAHARPELKAFTWHPEALPPARR